MRKLFIALPLCTLAVLLAGCGTITNLTPSQYLRTPDNLYHFEVKLDTRQQSLRWDSIKPVVKIGDQEYPMERVRNLRNRWETQVPVAADQKIVFYSYRFRYDYNDFNGPSSESRDSENYRLMIVEK
jgi:hypothetical protein